MDDLIERYLQAVGFWLPERGDVVAEIAEDLRSQIADEEKMLGHELTSSELEALLKRRGRPFLVANGYRPQTSLIGPVWFPIYVLVLKAVMLCGVLPWIAVWFVVARVQHPAAPWLSSVLAAGGMLCSLAFMVAGIVTLLFAVLEWSESCAHFFEQWSPNKLQPVRTPDTIPLSSSVTELTVNVVFFFLWTIYARSPVVFDGPSFRLALAANWNSFFWGFLIVSLGNIALAVAHLQSRRWTRSRAVVRMLLDLTSGAFFCCMMKAHLLTTLYSAGLGHEGSLALQRAIDVWMDRCFPIAVIVVAIVITVDALRLVRVSKTRSYKAAQVFAVLLAFLLTTHASRAQLTATNNPVSPALPSESELRTILADHIDTQRQSVGMVAAITEPGAQRLATYGRLSQSGPRQVSGDTVFEIGSLTKIFTALLLADMVQRGEVSLSDPVAKYLPSEVRLPERNGHAITLLDLATQTSGLPFFPTDIPLNDPQAAERAVASYSTAQLYAFLSRYELTRDIGSKWEYSNTGFALLGDALARRSGMDYESLVKARITGPLGMNDTAVTLTPAMHSRMASGYDAALKPAPAVNMPAFLPAGGLHSTANDLLIFLDAFLEKKPSPLAGAMQSMLVPRRPGPSFQQALGWWVISLGATDSGFFFHGGETPGFSSSLAFDPKSRIGVVVLSNCGTNDGGLAWHVMRAGFPLADSASVKARQQQTDNEVPLDPGIAAHDVGAYRIDSGLGAGEVIKIERLGDVLVVKTSSTPPEGLRLHTHDNRTFFVTETDLRMKFSGDPSKAAQSLSIQFAGTETLAQREQ